MTASDADMLNSTSTFYNSKNDTGKFSKFSNSSETYCTWLLCSVVCQMAEMWQVQCPADGIPLARSSI